MPNYWLPNQSSLPILCAHQLVIKPNQFTYTLCLTIVYQTRAVYQTKAVYLYSVLNDWLSNQSSLPILCANQLVIKPKQFTYTLCSSFGYQTKAVYLYSVLIIWLSTQSSLPILCAHQLVSKPKQFTYTLCSSFGYQTKAVYIYSVLNNWL